MNVVTKVTCTPNIKYNLQDRIPWGEQKIHQSCGIQQQHLEDGRQHEKYPR